MKKEKEISAIKRFYSRPDEHWNWPIHVSHQHGVRCGDMIFVGGQVDLDPKGNVRNPGNLKSQSLNALDNIHKVLAEFYADLVDVVKLVVFYVSDGSIDETTFLADLGVAFGAGPGLAITAVPVPYLSVPDIAVDIEAIAMLSTDGRRLSREAANPVGHLPLPPPFLHGVRCGEMIYVSGQVACDVTRAVLHSGDILKQTEVVKDNLSRVLEQFGAILDDAVKKNDYYVGQGTEADWEPAARVRASYFTEPGPIGTGVPVPLFNPDGVTIKTDVTAMLGTDGHRLSRSHSWPEGHWDWPIHVPYKHGLKCGNMIFVGGQVSIDTSGQVINPGNMVAQTHTSMENIRKVLAVFGAKMDDIVKVNAFYKGGSSAQELCTNLEIRSGYFSDPGPVTTSTSLPCLAYEDMMIEIEVIAMSE